MNDVRTRVIIRPYRREDRQALRDLVLQLHETMRPFDPDLAPGAHIIDVYFTQLLRRRRRTRGAIFVADAAGRLVGHVCVFGLLTPQDLDERSSLFSWMAELFVVPEYRNHSIGERLVEAAEQHARRLGASKMELNVLAENTSARRFYERVGYAPRVVVMTKRLDDEPSSV